MLILLCMTVCWVSVRCFALVPDTCRKLISTRLWVPSVSSRVCREVVVHVCALRRCCQQQQHTHLVYCWAGRAQRTWPCSSAVGGITCKATGCYDDLNGIQIPMWIGRPAGRCICMIRRHPCCDLLDAAVQKWTVSAWTIPGAQFVP